MFVLYSNDEESRVQCGKESAGPQVTQEQTAVIPTLTPQHIVLSTIYFNSACKDSTHIMIFMRNYSNLNMNISQ